MLEFFLVASPHSFRFSMQSFSKSKESVSTLSLKIDAIFILLQDPKMHSKFFDFLKFKNDFEANFLF